MCAASLTAPPRPSQGRGAGLTRLAELAGVPALGQSVQVTGVTLRAQQVRPGDLFAALPGATVHGAAFADDAVAAGAVAVLTDPAGAAAVGDTAVPVLICPDPRAVLGTVAAEVYGNPSESMAVLGITGTSGKTTTCYLIEAALTAAGVRSGLIGTVQTRIAGAVVPSVLTTPEAPDLQALLACMVEQDVRAVAMEVSSHALALRRVAGTRYAVGGFTNLSQDHLDFHTDMESYFQAKSLLFDGRARAEVIDVDDAYGQRLYAAHPGASTVSAAGREDTDWGVRSIESAQAGHQRLRLRTPNGDRDAELALPGTFNVANALMALAVIQSAGLADLDDTLPGLASVVVPGRMEKVDAGQGFLVVVDYAHKPAAVTAVLSAVARELTGRLIVVVGAGGDRDKGKRPAMGEAAAQWADLVVVTDDNPRSESPAAIRATVLAGARHARDRQRPGHADIIEIGDRGEAIRTAIRSARTGDAVVIAGKGHERGQDVGGVVHPFSDVEAARNALGGVSA